MKIRIEHEIEATMLLKIITELIDDNDASISKSKILTKLKHRLTEHGQGYFWAWFDNEILTQCAHVNQVKITETFNKYWDIKSHSSMVEFFDNCNGLTVSEQVGYQ